MRYKFLPLYRSMVARVAARRPVLSVETNISLSDPSIIPDNLFVDFQPIEEPESNEMPVSQPETKGSLKDRAASHIKLLCSPDMPLPLRLEACRQLRALKRSSKKSWQVLGLTDAQFQMMTLVMSEEDNKPKPSRRMQVISARLKGKL